MNDSQLRENTIIEMRKLVSEAGVSRDDGYIWFTFDKNGDAYCFKKDVRREADQWVYREYEGASDDLYLDESGSSSIMWTLLMTADDIFGEANE